jgi:hypothetical protein
MSTMPSDRDASAHAEVQAAVVPVGGPNLEEAVRRFVEFAKELDIGAPPSQELNELCRQVAAFTGDLFPGEWAVKVKNDPEIPSDLYFVFAVRAAGTIDDVVARNDQWHRSVVGVEGKRHGLFRLAIDAH